MEKLLLFVLMAVVWLTAQVQQIDEEMAMKALFEGKHAVNRAAHAAAQQLDGQRLAYGEVHIDPGEAMVSAKQYLRANLQLDGMLNPTADSLFRDRVDIALFEVINEDHTFPYTYRNAAYNYEVTLERPGVIMIIRLQYPRAFNVLQPIEWYVKGAAELVY
ncbi:hypothetical protein [Paenibacillus kobensis]|uniref:hypothetical protein n=1 Tax=Paenibacillus kobensis TaxID=59841 RepID=UPI000FD78CFE|nr:hypothetical protein [Paenibacillus kobensis]